MAENTSNTAFDDVMMQIPMPELKDNESKEIFQAYTNMFTALTYANLLQKKSLGQSWFNAIGQIESFVNAKDKYNSVTNHMQRVLNTHRKDLAKKMMTDPNRDKIISVTPQQREKMTQQSNQMMQSAMQTINQMIEKYRDMAEKLKQQLAQQAQKRAQALQQAAQKSEKIAQKQKPEPAKQTAAPVTQPRAPEFGTRPQRPKLSEFARYKAAQNNLGTYNAVKTESRPVNAAAPTQPAPVAKTPVAKMSGQNTAAKLADTTQKLKTLNMQRIRIQMFMKNQQNQHAA